MKITCVLEFLGGARGWQATAELPDKQIATSGEVGSQHEALAGLRAALQKSGFVEPELDTKLRLPCILEFVGQEQGWRAAAELPDGQVKRLSEVQSPQAARRRLRRAAAEAGVDVEDFGEKIRIPQHLQAELAEYRRIEKEREELDIKVLKLRPRLAQRLLTELNLTEREVSTWLGISHTHLATSLLAYTADTAPTGEYVRSDAQDNAQTLTRRTSKR